VAVVVIDMALQHLEQLEAAAQEELMLVLG
jgi:hypothetical protein